MSDPNTHLGPNARNVTGLDGIAFLAELVAFVAIGMLGFALVPAPWSWVGAVVLPIVAMVLWAVFRAPKRVWPGTPIWLRTVVELVVMGAAVWGLTIVGWWPVAVIFGIGAVLLAVRRLRADLRERSSTTRP